MFGVDPETLMIMVDPESLMVMVNPETLIIRVDHDQMAPALCEVIGTHRDTLLEHMEGTIYKSWQGLKKKQAWWYLDHGFLGSRITRKIISFPEAMQAAAHFTIVVLGDSRKWGKNVQF